MDKNNLIPIQHILTHYNTEISFVNSLHDSGLIEISTIEENIFIEETQISAIEKMIHLHYDLDINIEGIEAITHLLQKMEEMKKEMQQLKNKLSVFNLSAFE